MVATKRGERVNQFFSQALQLLQAGRQADAMEMCQRVLTDQSGHPGANYLLGYQALQDGVPGKAVTLMGLAIANGLHDAAAFHHYGTALAMTRRYADAALQFARALAEKSDFEEARINLANSYFELGALPEAHDQYKYVIEQNPSSWKAYHNLAHVYYYLGKVDEAVHFFRQATIRNPGYAEAHASLASMLELNNQPEEAAIAARQALYLQAGNASAQNVLAKCLRRKKLYEEALSALDSIDSDTASERTYISIHNERGQNLDQLGRYGEAYRAFAASKQALRRLRGTQYDPLEEFKPLDIAEAYFTRQKIQELKNLIAADACSSYPTPVFVVGFHRSGTTLVEQILSSHPDIGAAGELEAIPHLEFSLSRNTADLPRALEGLLAKNEVAPLLELRKNYLARLAGAGCTSGKWVIDKSLFNMLHLPMIHLLFPESPIVHVLRHPMDTVLSVFSQNFLWGNDWSLTLPNTAQAFERTWLHVERIVPQMPDLRYMRIRYEDLIAATDFGIRRMLAFLGADYQSVCLDFHENKRVARTASYEQISRPIYSTSVERYLNYMSHIEPEVIATLRPVAASMGYILSENTKLPA
jgi:tetratricopeptide (TPR) repeat protein